MYYITCTLCALFYHPLSKSTFNLNYEFENLITEIRAVSIFDAESTSDRDVIDIRAI